METTTQAEQFLHVEREYAHCLTVLNRTGILTLLPNAESLGVIGIDGQEYPVPSRDQVASLFNYNRELIASKVPQGFDRLTFTPLAMPVMHLVDLAIKSILRHTAENKIYQARHSPSDPLIPVRVNPGKQIWIWETLRKALETDALIYFPQEYSNNHRGQTKQEAIHNGDICAVPGWSVGLVERSPFIPLPGQGLTLGNRKQLEIGSSPREYLQTLRSEAYHGETGKTIEDFITSFLTNLETNNEVSNDVHDKNALWCLGQYLEIPYAELVPTARWFRGVGRIRLDLHRTGNKLCTSRWGASTIIRLHKS